MKFRFSLLPVFLLALLFALGACKKSGDDEPDIDYSARDKELIENYISTNSLTGFTQDSAGVYISVTQPGTGTLPIQGRTIVAKYKGTTLDGKVFDQTKETIIGYPFILGGNQVIEGWDDAFPQLRKGSKAILLIESDKGYGGTPTGNIPAHSVLRFDVEVVDIR